MTSESDGTHDTNIALARTGLQGVTERWYLGSMNDGLFIINTPPRPSNDDVWHDRPDGPTLALALESLSAKRAQAIVDAHNAALSPLSGEAGDAYNNDLPDGVPLSAPSVFAAPVKPEPVGWQWSDFSGKWYTVDAARMGLQEQEELARACAKDHDGRVRPIYAAPPSPTRGEPGGGETALEQIIRIDQQKMRRTVEVDPAGNTYEIEEVDGPCAALARKALAALPASAMDARPTHRHKKRGTEYVLIEFGKMQAEDWVDQSRAISPPEDPRPLPVDMREVAIYRSVDDGSWWVRPREEFEGGRFEPLRSLQGGGE